ncbi:MAG: glycosyltransferase family 4 protein, partial [Verrucomicrobiaceae bacterium]|nr:glycosyltransferase family 4 protein [Verrucomicrobiaceae bacterium]
LRAELGIEPGRPVILFCAKLISVKDPATLIRAVGMAKEANPALLFAGDGALRGELETLAAEVAPGLVKFLGFRNQTELPAYYDLCDLFVLPSVFEPWGLVVNEVMNAAKPVIVSDKIGSGHDLVKPGLNGEVFRAGDAADLHAKMRPWLRAAALREQGGAASRRIINNWGFEQALTGLKAAMSALSS